MSTCTGPSAGAGSRTSTGSGQGAPTAVVIGRARHSRRRQEDVGIQDPRRVERALDLPKGRYLGLAPVEVEPRSLGRADPVFGADAAPAAAKRSTRSSTLRSSGSTPVMFTWTLPSAAWPKSHVVAAGLTSATTPGTRSMNSARAAAGSVTSSLWGAPKRVDRLGMPFAVAPQLGPPVGSVATATS